MKSMLSFFMLMSSLATNAQMGKAQTLRRTFSRTTTVITVIQADPVIVWALLTNGHDFNRWNSTVISLEGEINVGERIQLKSTLDPDRIFRLKVKEMITGQRMVWVGSFGKRVFTLGTKDKDTIFKMTEKIASPLFPLFSSKIPPMDQAFERFASDLKKEAEKIAQLK